MSNIPGLLGLVLMLLVSAETKSGQQQSFQSDNGLRIEINNTEKLQEVNIGSMYILFIFTLFQYIKKSLKYEQIIAPNNSTNTLGFVFKSIFTIFHRTLLMLKKEVDLARKFPTRSPNCNFIEDIWSEFRIQDLLGNWNLTSLSIKCLPLIRRS